MVETKSKTIGSMNGLWQFGFKIALVTYPLVMTWGIWVTNETMIDKLLRDNRVTKIELKDLSAELKDHVTNKVNTLQVELDNIEDRVNTLPPTEWRTRIIELERQSQEFKLTAAEIKSDLKYLVDNIRKTTSNSMP